MPPNQYTLLTHRILPYPYPYCYVPSGCPSVSVEVGKILLSLAPHPCDDPYGVLLALDFYLLSAGKYAEVFAFAGLTLTR